MLARAAGISESEYIRRALDRAFESSPPVGRLRERLGDVIGSVRGGGGVAERASDAFADLLAEETERRKA